MAKLIDEITTICEQAILNQVFPGCVVGYIREGDAEILPFGGLRYDESAPTVTAKTVYDVASVTKSIPTNVLIIKLIEDGVLDLDDPVVRYIPELDNEWREQILIRHLLTYSVVFDLPALATVAERDPAKLLEILLHAPLKAPPGELYFYTNGPAILLGMIIERVTRKRLDVCAREALFDPLGMNDTAFWAEELAGREFAPTEVTAHGDEICGLVHDEAARALRQSGMVAGNAGLFTTAYDLLRFGRMMIDGGSLGGKRFFSAKMMREMSTNQLSIPKQYAGLGWEIRRPDFMGSCGSDQLFGKTGFTGCIVLIDPVRRAILVHLSNRTYPKRTADRGAINAVRRALANVVLA